MQLSTAANQHFSFYCPVYISATINVWIFCALEFSFLSQRDKTKMTSKKDLSSTVSSLFYLNWTIVFLFIRSSFFLRVYFLLQWITYSEQIHSFDFVQSYFQCAMSKTKIPRNVMLFGISLQPWAAYVQVFSTEFSFLIRIFKSNENKEMKI